MFEVVVHMNLHFFACLLSIGPEKDKNTGNEIVINVTAAMPQVVMRHTCPTTETPAWTDVEQNMIICPVVLPALQQTLQN